MGQLVLLPASAFYRKTSHAMTANWRESTPSKLLTPLLDPLRS